MKSGDVLLVAWIGVFSCTGTPAWSQAWQENETQLRHQGRLVLDGVPADGEYDLRFWLYESAAAEPTAGPLIFDGAEGNPGPISVTRGRYTVDLDFHLPFSDVNPYRLRVEGRRHKSGEYVVLEELPLDAQAVEVVPILGDSANPISTFVTTFVPLDLGVGTTAAEAPLHVMEGAAGSVTANADSIAVFERGSQGFLSILTPDATARGIAFGDPSNPVNGSILYNTSAIQDGFEFRTGGNGVRMVLTSAGDVGIGTTSPLFDLQVNRLSQVGGLQTPAQLGLRWATTSIPQLVEWCYLAVGGNAPFGDVHLVRKSGTDFRFSTESTIAAGPTGTQMILTGAGNVGIGTTAPSNRLSVSGSANITSNAYVGGDLGIGTTSPAERLHVVGGSNVQTTGGGFLILGPMTSTNVAIDNNEIMARNNGAASSLFLNKSGGNVAIGTSSAPQQKLDVNGAIRSRGIFFPGSFNPGFGQPGNFLSFGHPGVSEDYLGYDAHYFFFWDSPGGGDTELPIVQAGGFSDVSDVRLKKDIRNIEGGLEKVMRLQGISYRFDGRKIDPDATQYDDNERVRLGFSAQAVAEVVPEVVNYSEALDTYGISYGAMVPLLVEAMKEQQSLIEDLRSQQADLLERLEKLEALTGAAGTTRK